MFKEPQIWDSTKEPSLVVCTNCGKICSGIFYVFCAECRNNEELAARDNKYEFDIDGGTLVRKSLLIQKLRNEMRDIQDIQDITLEN